MLRLFDPGEGDDDRAFGDDRSIFPLPLVPFEAMAYHDNWPGYPMSCGATFTFRGQIIPQVFERAVRIANLRHPLIEAVLERRFGGRLRWIAGDRPFQPQWIGAAEPTDFMRSLPYDLQRESGARIWVQQRDNEANVFTEFHHTCCDGAGGLAYMEDIFAAYHLLVQTGGVSPSDLPPIQSALLRHRGKFPLPSGFLSYESLQELQRRFEMLSRTAVPVAAPRRETHLPQEQRFISRAYEREVLAELRQQASSAAATLNDLLLCQLMQTITVWNRIWSGDTKGWMRMLVPINLRGRDDLKMPMTNRLSYGFFTRRMEDYRADREQLVSISRESTWMRKTGMPVRLLKKFHWMQLTGAWPLVFSPHRCLTTAVFSNLGDPTRRFRFRFPRQQGQITVGNMVMTNFAGTTALRPQTRIGLFFNTYGSRLTISAHSIRRSIRPPTSNRFLIFIRSNSFPASDEPPLPDRLRVRIAKIGKVVPRGAPMMLLQQVARSVGLTTAAAVKGGGRPGTPMVHRPSRFCVQRPARAPRLPNRVALDFLSSVTSAAAFIFVGGPFMDHPGTPFEVAMAIAFRPQLRVVLRGFAFLAIAAAMTAARGETSAANRSDLVPQWIWSPEHAPEDVPQVSCYFRKTIHLPGPHRGTIRIAADDVYKVYVNGSLIGEGSSSRQLTRHDITAELREGKNVIAVKVDNRNGQTAGLAAEVFVEDDRQQGRLYLTNPTWRTSLRTLPLWDSVAYRDGRWKAARNLGPFVSDSADKRLLGGTARPAEPRGEAITRKDGTGRPTATDATAAIKRDTDAARNSSASSSEQAIPRGRDLEYPEFSVRPGFQVQHVAGHEETGSILAMAFNEFGQILVSQEGGPLLLIYDSNDNGSPDQVRICCQQVSSCQGILPISGQVFVIGEGASGTALYRLEDDNHDGDFEKATAILKFQGPLGEHGPHGLTLGPDGLIYIALGNQARINQPYAVTSPLRNVYEGELVAPRYEDPQVPATDGAAPGGSVVRVDLAGKRPELFSGGQCNIRDLAFNGAGDLIMHDADTESDLGTPWHRPTRLIFAAAGSDYGWRSGWAKWPDYYLDSLPPILDTGRGAPAGCLFYQHTAFPAKYRNAFFSCDWSQGAIYCFRLDRRGAGYAAHRELFLQGKPLNVTDIDVGPDGALYFCTGGRGTQGNIFRVVPTESKRPAEPQESRILQAMRQPGLNTAWGRQAISTLRQEMGNEWDRKIREFVADPNVHAIDRANALQVMHLIGPPPSDVELIDISHATDASVRAKAAYLMGLIGNDLTSLRLVELLHDEAAIVRRKACEGLARTNQPVAFSEIQPLLLSPDRFEASAARGLLERNETEDWVSLVLQSDNHRVFAQGALAIMRVSPSRSSAKRVVRRFQQLSEAIYQRHRFRRYVACGPSRVGSREFARRRCSGTRRAPGAGVSCREHADQS